MHAWEIFETKKYNIIMHQSFVLTSSSSLAASSFFLRHMRFRRSCPALNVSTQAGSNRGNTRPGSPR